MIVGLTRRRSALVLAGALLASAAHALPPFAKVKQQFTSSESRLLSREGEVLQRLRTDASVRRGDWVPLADVSPALRTALLLSEDKRFYEHSGVDWSAVGAAAWGNLWHTRTRGASTLTMQLVGLVQDDLKRGRGGRTLLQKFGQVAAAQQLERGWRKDHILEAYLNLVPFRGDVVGIDALSRTLFDKAPHGMTSREAAIAAALVRAPNATPQAVAQRACGVLTAMGEPQNSLSCDALALYTTGVLQRKAWAPSDGIAPHLARRLLANQPAGTALRSSVSAPLQRQALALLRQQLKELAGRNVQDGAVLVLDNASGEVLAWVGSSGDLSGARQVDAVTAPRQPGSTLKPFLYAQALAEKRLTAASLIDDSAAAVPTGNGLYVPHNYDRQYMGWVSVRTALGASLNIPAVRTLGLVGVNAFARQLRALGMTLPQPGDHYGFSLALGSAETTLLHLTNAYRALANQGRLSQVRFQTSNVAPTMTPVLDARAVFIVNDILSDPNARLTTFGHDSVLGTRVWSAVKTGTSKDMRDNWAVGHSARYTVGVWVGNAGGAPMWNVSGVSGAAPVWAQLMAELHRQQPSTAPAPPRDVVQQTVRFEVTSGGQAEPPRNEWFIAGTAQPLFRVAATERSAARIDSPADGSIFALDPDMPPAHQRVTFSTTRADGQWWLDGKKVAQGKRWLWLPWPGRHVMELRAPSGEVLDTVRLEVRGAGVADKAQRSR